MGRGRSHSGVLLGLLLVGSLGTGCISLATVETGSAPEWETVALLREGTPLEDVLEVCGVPIQTLAQPDGLLLIYRKRIYDFKRVGFQPAIATRLVDFTGVVTTALENLKLVFEWGRVDERRLVVLFDREDRMTAAAYQDLGSGR